MKNKNLPVNKWGRCFPIPAFFLTLLVSGCQADSRTENVPVNANFPEETSPLLHSDTLPEDCYVCGDGKGTALPLYHGQENLGIININTFDLAPVTINRYDDYGKSSFPSMF